MYYFYLDKLALPIAPPSLNIKINGSNKTVRLIDDSEINIIKNAGLTDVAFEFMIPNSDYPFANNGVMNLANGLIGNSFLNSIVSSLLNGTFNGNKYLDKMEKLKTSKRPFQFIVTRMKGKQLMFNTNLCVTLEDYEVKEAAEYGFDQMVSVRLKQYRHYSTKILNIDKDGKATVQKTRR